MPNKRLDHLFGLYIAKQISAAEQNELMLLIADKANEEQVKSLFEKTWDEFEHTGPVFTGAESEKILANVFNSDTSVIHPRRARVRRMSFSTIAAAAIILMACSIALFLYLKPKTGTATNPAMLAKADILPGSNKAVLILGNHKKIVLNDGKKGEIARQNGMLVTQLKSGEVVYTALNTTSQNAEAAYNTLETPKGGQFEVTLPDGTKVWLNAASSLRFPTAFVGKERHVELTGEGYFEVAKNKNMPFTVLANGVNVKVLGTHFDVMAYADEPQVNTVLLEGSVLLQKGDQSKILKPGELGIALKGSNNITVNTADLETAIAWKNGLFVFKDQDIKDIMRQAARWYDVDVAFVGDLKARNFGGKTSRYKNITDLLTNMQLTGAIHYKIEGRRVIIMP